MTRKSDTNPAEVIPPWFIENLKAIAAAAAKTALSVDDVIKAADRWRQAILDYYTEEKIKQLNNT